MTIGNLAHIELLQGNMTNAINIHKKHQFNLLDSGFSWAKMIKDGFSKFEELGYDMGLMKTILNKSYI